MRRPHKNYPIERTKDKLIKQPLYAYEIPLIRIININGIFHSIDNRRLWTFKNAKITSIKVKLIERNYYNEKKFT